MFEFGKLIRKARREQGLTQQDLAEQTGLSRVTISGIETDMIVEIGFRKLERILLRLGYNLYAQKITIPTLDDLKERDVFFGDRDE